MAKEITHSVKLCDPIQPDPGPDRHLIVNKCDDGSVYVFQKMEDAPIWNLRRRGSTDEPVRSWSDRSAPLPQSVKDVMNRRVGEHKWRK